MFKKVFQWVVYSSADPKKIALTVKSAGLGIAPVLMLVTGISGDEATAVIGGISNLVFYILSAISVTGMLYGSARKVVLSFTR